jgi:hypothetical protein
MILAFHGPELARRMTRWRKRRIVLRSLADSLLLLAVIVPRSSDAARDSKPPTQPTAQLFEKYCFECHGDGVAKGKIALDEMLENAKSSSHHTDWEKAWKIVRHEFMPPAGAERPSPTERRAITQWIEQSALGVDYDHPDPGRVTIRRLNRMEYDYTVTDLFGVDLSADQNYISDRSLERRALRDRLPPDDTAFGFDNNGDFLSLSPALLEKFIGLAEYVVENVIVLDGPRHPRLDLGRAGLKTTRSEASKRFEQSVNFELQHTGPYLVEAQFSAGNFAELAGTYEFVIRMDDRQLTRDEILVGGHKIHKYSENLDLEKGRHQLVLSALPIKGDAKGKTNYLEFRPGIQLTGPIGTGIYEYPESHRKVFFHGDPPKGLHERRAYARAIVQRVADRAFRRPADASTLDRLTEIVMSNAQFERGVAQALTAILASPKFLFRAELQRKPDDPKSVSMIDEYALASRLSYLLWLSLPDEELTRLAAQGRLRKNLEAQVKRLLADPKSERFFEDFPGQWLRTRNILMTSISRVDVPLNPVRASMKRETEMLFEYIVRQDRDLLELVTADYTFADRKLADFYGIKGVDGEGFQKVLLTPETHRGGILTQGSFLVSTSNPNRTSPVKRGLFVLENLLAVQVPSPPANVPPLDEAKAGGATPGTVREQLAAHRENKACAACHAHFDPIGVVLENYDIIGRWRTRENGTPIETREKTLTGEALSGVADLRNLFVTRKEKFYRCVTEKLLTYAVGRGLEPFDAVTVDRITDQLIAGNGKFSTLLLAAVASPPFQLRRGDDGEIKTPPRIALPEPPPPDQRKGRKRRIDNAVNVENPANTPAAKPAIQPIPKP